MMDQVLLLGLNSLHFFAFSTSLALLLRVLKLWNKQSKGRLPLPPGPKPLPFIGNVMDLPRKYGWLLYTKWKKQYGDVIYASAFRTPTVILNSSEAVIELLEKRSAIYSDRSRLPMLNELTGWVEWAFPFMNYGPRWRRHRKAFHQYFSATASQRYRAVHVIETRRAMQRILGTPEQFRHHIRHLTTATIMRITYGVEVQDANDRFIKIAEESVDSIARAGAPGAFLVDIFPMLKYVPSWFPGADFKRLAVEWRKANEAHINVAFDYVSDCLNQNKGSVEPSMASDMLQAAKTSPEPDAELFARNLSATSYAGGTDTTISSLISFFMAMVLYPDAQRKAQEELDAVLCGARLPEFSDRPSLPYIEATVQEVHRWLPVLPLGNPHVSTKDDVYNGYHIPKGSIVIPNVWAILRDEDAFPDPEKFNPDRFLKDGRINPDILKPEKFAFGFGRRVCPGIHVADDSMFIAIASILTCFNIKPAMDDSGRPIPIEITMSTGLLSFPGHFDCSVEPRNANVPSLIMRGLNQGGD